MVNLKNNHEQDWDLRALYASSEEVPALVRELDATAVSLGDSIPRLMALKTLKMKFPRECLPPLSRLQAKTLSQGMPGLTVWLQQVPLDLTDLEALLQQTAALPGAAALQILAAHRQALTAPFYKAFWHRIFRQSDGKALAEAALGLLQTRWPRELWVDQRGFDAGMAIDLAVLLYVTPDPWVQRGLYDCIIRALPPVVATDHPDLLSPQWPLAKHWLRVSLGDAGEALSTMAFLTGQLDPETIRNACLGLLNEMFEETQGIDAA